MIAAELLWGAVAQGLIAIGQTNGWRINGHSFYKYAAAELEKQDASQPWQSDVAVADQLHIHFYDRHLTAGDLRSRRTIAKHLLTRIHQYLN